MIWGAGFSAGGGEVAVAVKGGEGSDDNEEEVEKRSSCFGGGLGFDNQRREAGPLRNHCGN